MKNAIKVLIVDDDKASAQALTEVVKRMGFKAIVASKPVEAMNIVKLHTVHAAILDVLLPKTSGVDLALEFRKTKFSDSPIIFVSGVFKDKAFAADAVKKTGALNFLFKPYGVDDVRNALNGALASMLSTEQWSVHSILTRVLSGMRERVKAIEHLEQIRGLDFPFILSMLMEGGVSGNINLINELGEIFGVTLVKGAVAAVDSRDSQATGILALISKGYLSQEDWEKFEMSKPRYFSLDRLVQEGYVSPHAVSDARHEQIMSDFRALSTSASLQLNMVLGEDDKEPPKHALKLSNLFGLLEAAQDDLFSEVSLQEFYAPVANLPFYILATPAEIGKIFSLPLFKEVPELCRAIENGGTFEKVLTAMPANLGNVYRALHYLVLGRTIMFQDLNHDKRNDGMLERYRNLFAELQSKTADKVFSYFGAAPNASRTVIENIYQEYLKSNHPDQLPANSPAELKSVCTQCFDLVTGAYAVLMDDTQKAKLYEQLKSQNAERLSRASQLTAEGLEILRKGQFRQALQMLIKAEAEAPSARQFQIMVWAELKVAPPKRTRLQELLTKLDGASADDRRSAFYFMALGLVKKYLGDPNAQACFERALQMDSLFVEARRELNTPLKGEDPNKKVDILTGDITAVVSQLFRRKAE